jgi:hypothetical protein
MEIIQEGVTSYISLVHEMGEYMNNGLPGRVDAEDREVYQVMCIVLSILILCNVLLQLSKTSGMVLSLFVIMVKVIGESFFIIQAAVSDIH